MAEALAGWFTAFPGVVGPVLSMVERAARVTPKGSVLEFQQTKVDLATMFEAVQAIQATLSEHPGSEGRLVAMLEEAKGAHDDLAVFDDDLAAKAPTAVTPPAKYLYVPILTESSDDVSEVDVIMFVAQCVVAGARVPRISSPHAWNVQFREGEVKIAVKNVLFSECLRRVLLERHIAFCDGTVPHLPAALVPSAGARACACALGSKHGCTCSWPTTVIGSDIFLDHVRVPGDLPMLATTLRAIKMSVQTGLSGGDLKMKRKPFFLQYFSVTLLMGKDAEAARLLAGLEKKECLVVRVTMEEVLLAEYVHAYFSGCVWGRHMAATGSGFAGASPVHEVATLLQKSSDLLKFHLYLFFMA
jgi:hypothetical protein